MSNTYVLIHGAWHGGWAWRPVAEHMRHAGHIVLTPTMPGLSWGDDPTAYTFDDVIDHVVDLIEAGDLSDVILVAHSWGGAVAAAVAPRVPERLRKIIFWGAFVPGGASLVDDLPDFRELFASLSAESGNNTVSLPFDAWAGAFIADASPEVQLLTHQLLSPHPMQYFDHSVAPLDVDGLGLPIAYLMGEEDITAPRDGQYGWLRFAERVKAVPVMVPGSHEALFTSPRELADAFLSAS